MKKRFLIESSVSQSIIALIAFFSLTASSQATQYYHGPLVQASRGCFDKDSHAIQVLSQGAAKGNYEDIQAYAAYWVCKTQPEKAIPWLKKSSNMGNGWSSQMLAHYALKKMHIDGTEALKYLNRSALQGNAWAARELANIYLNGLYGIGVDLHKASYWALYAENVKEIVPNTFYLAASYRNGWGVPKNFKKAKQLYAETMHVLKEAADGGDPYADILFFEFYTKYSQDVGMKKNMHQASYWLNQAAAKGYPPAIAILSAKKEHITHE
ncbi:tetratricopeptide repeat protein [Acidithiobacillus albertensis]|uniref:tetratricopeptide repeat protein n=1 Tax=Acidithiobacillus albertensis TaxID=119978 RepID=UPI001C078EC5|nr:tetratricopeptide repeat protein [Acidithiobacillus albertensis]MBU2741013.1 sel1 repeat family protein [Acidithiobacillus albertensis]